jgi:indolepyruvate ferredoxin oxidoreductase
VVNCAETPTADFTRNPDWRFPVERMQAAIGEAAGEGAVDFTDATALARRLMGDAIATNLILLGYAWQKGLVPVTLTSLEKAIELNGVQVETNRRALLWGRRAAHDPAAVERFCAPAAPVANRPLGLEELIARRAQYLAAYQDRAYARRYQDFVRRFQATWEKLGSPALAEAVANGYFRVLAYKDEYEVARLYADPAFADGLRRTFEGDFRLAFHLAPPLWAARDPLTGEPRKKVYGPWMLGAFRVLAKLRFLRGSRFDPFAGTEERREERQMIRDYEADIERIAAELTGERLAIAIEIARLPQEVRGFGHVKARNLAQARKRREELWHAWTEVPRTVRAA